MLSAETGIGRYPVEAVRAMSRVAEAAEESPDPWPSPRIHPHTPAATVMHAAVELADELDAAALVVPTEPAELAPGVRQYRHRQPIIALTGDPVRQSADARMGRVPADDGAWPSPSTRSSRRRWSRRVILPGYRAVRASCSRQANRPGCPGRRA